MAAWDTGTGAVGADECAALVDVAEALRWSAPELAVQFAARSLAGQADPPTTSRANALLGSSLVRLGRAAEAVEPGLAALREATAAGAVERAAALRTALAGAARALGQPLIGAELLRPVLEEGGARQATRALALGQLASCTTHVGGRDDLEDALAEADRLLAADAELSQDGRKLERALLAATAAAYHRRHGDPETAEESARGGLGLLSRLGDRRVEGGRAHARLTLELVSALLDQGTPDEAAVVASPLLAEPVRAAAALSLGRLRLLVATRVLLPSGRAGSGRFMLVDVVRTAERHQLDSLLCDAWTLLAHAEEEAENPAAALHALRSARAAEYRRLAAAERARELLVAELGGAVTDPARAAELLRSAVAGPDQAGHQRTAPDRTRRGPAAGQAKRDRSATGTGQAGVDPAVAVQVQAAAAGPLDADEPELGQVGPERGGADQSTTVDAAHDPAGSGEPESDYAVALVRVTPRGVVDPADPVGDSLPLGADALLNALATHVRGLAPDDAELIRSDQGEFAVLLPNTSQEDAERLASSIRSAGDGDWLPDPARRVDISTGVATKPGTTAGPSEGVDALLIEARDALTALVEMPLTAAPRRADAVRRTKPDTDAARPVDAAPEAAPPVAGPESAHRIPPPGTLGRRASRRASQEIRRPTPTELTAPGSAPAADTGVGSDVAEVLSRSGVTARPAGGGRRRAEDLPFGGEDPTELSGHQDEEPVVAAEQDTGRARHGGGADTTDAKAILRRFDVDPRHGTRADTGGLRRRPETGGRRADTTGQPTGHRPEPGGRRSDPSTSDTDRLRRRSAAASESVDAHSVLRRFDTAELRRRVQQVTGKNDGAAKRADTTGVRRRGQDGLVGPRAAQVPTGPIDVHTVLRRVDAAEPPALERSAIDHEARARTKAAELPTPEPSATDQDAVARAKAAEVTAAKAVLSRFGLNFDDGPETPPVPAPEQEPAAGGSGPAPGTPEGDDVPGSAQAVLDRFGLTAEGGGRRRAEKTADPDNAGTGLGAELVAPALNTPTQPDAAAPTAPPEPAVPTLAVSEVFAPLSVSEALSPTETDAPLPAASVPVVPEPDDIPPAGPDQPAPPEVPPPPGSDEPVDPEGPNTPADPPTTASSIPDNVASLVDRRSVDFSARLRGLTRPGTDEVAPQVRPPDLSPRRGREGRRERTASSGLADLLAEAMEAYEATKVDPAAPAHGEPGTGDWAGDARTADDIAGTGGRRRRAGGGGSAHAAGADGPALGRSGLPTPSRGIRGRHRSSEWAPVDFDSG
ncbi:hypothetical protein [Actinokineospora pegani]|uniref:hypothetical protein n=1 Tax=Actinokineospora pegani TaxID=2654637 RepID=UPI0012EA8C42|nr:hypothetical protein [Actinokineospora pegani]